MTYTDEEIIKALECCSENGAGCHICPLRKERGCKNFFDADIIKRQRAEIERLNAENMLTMSERNAFRTSFYEVSKRLKHAKSEAVKEFAERLKARVIEDFLEYKTDATISYIENLVKEMLGDSNG